MIGFHLRRLSSCTLTACLLVGVLALAPACRCPRTTGMAAPQPRVEPSVTRGFVLHGSGRTMGIPAEFEMTYLPGGRFGVRIDSQLAMSFGFDGHRGWMVDETGMPGPLDLEALETQQLLHWLVSGYWRAPNAPLDVQPVEGADSDLRLRVRGGSQWMDLWLDEDGESPRQARWTTFGADCIADFGPALDREGVRLPRSVRIDEAGVVTEIRVDAVRPLPADGEQACRLRERRPDDTVYHGDRPSRVPLQRMPSGHLLLRARVDGGEPGWFLLDSGAGRSILHLERADELGLGAIGSVSGAGIGGIVELHFRPAHRLDLGPLEIRDPSFLDMDLTFLSQVFGRRIEGILGYDLLARCTAELDLKEVSLEIHPVDHRRRDVPEWVDLLFHRNIPAVPCSFSGGEALFGLDTGAQGTVIFHHEASRRFGLEHGAGDEIHESQGAGGTAPIRNTRLEWIELGGHRFRDLPVSFSDDPRGALSGGGVAGLIGVQLLEHFRILLDYPHRRIAFLERAAEGS